MIDKKFELIARARNQPIRGAITKKKRENLGKISQRGGGVKKNRRKFPISIWEFEKPRGGGGKFSKMSEFQLFCNYFAILPL